MQDLALDYDAIPQQQNAKSQESASMGFGASGAAAPDSGASSPPPFSPSLEISVSACPSLASSVVFAFSSELVSEYVVPESPFVGLLSPLFSIFSSGWMGCGDGVSFNAVGTRAGFSFVGESSSSPSAIAATEVLNECVLLCRRVVAPVERAVVVSAPSGFAVGVAGSGG